MPQAGCLLVFKNEIGELRIVLRSFLPLLLSGCNTLFLAIFSVIQSEVFFMVLSMPGIFLSFLLYLLC